METPTGLGRIPTSLASKSLDRILRHNRRSRKAEILDVGWLRFNSNQSGIKLEPFTPVLSCGAVFFRLMGTGLFAVAELFYFAPALILGGANYLKAFSPDQLNSLALLSLKLYGYGAGIFIGFYGVASILLGYLMFRSGYLPRIIGALMALGGVGFVMSNLAFVLAPAYASSALLLPTIIAGFALTVWLLVRGVDVSKWQEKAAPATLS